MGHPLYLDRCIQLANLAGTAAFPNPKVGAVLVYNNKVIGEGFHKESGGPHAEVVAVKAVKDAALLSKATMYVSLEPCNHFGKTPPCTDLILQYQIPKVVVGCLDPNAKVSGKGIKRLREAGIEVTLADDPRPFVELNKTFFVNQQLQRPYICLKWAESIDGKIASIDQNACISQVKITGLESQAYVHRLRSQHQAILVGRRTAEIDNPQLTTRKFYGPDPVRIVLDPDLKLPTSLQLFSDGKKTLCINTKEERQERNVQYWKFENPKQNLEQLLMALYAEQQFCNIMVEGGTQVLQQFIDKGLWDEIHHLTGNIYIGEGVEAPVFQAENTGKEIHLGRDVIRIHRKENYTIIT